MNHSMYSADRATHLKIVVIGLLCATVVAVVGIFAHVEQRYRSRHRGAGQSRPADHDERAGSDHPLIADDSVIREPLSDRGPASVRRLSGEAPAASA